MTPTSGSDLALNKSPSIILIVYLFLAGALSAALGVFCTSDDLEAAKHTLSKKIEEGEKLSAEISLTIHPNGVVYSQCIL